MEYVIVIHAAEEGGFWAEFPALPGCHTQAETMDHLLQRAPEAIESYIEALREDGQEIADEKIFISTVRLPHPSAA